MLTVHNNFDISVSKSVGIENDLFLLSNTTFNSIKARATCSLIHTNLAQLDNNKVTDTLLPMFEDFYLKGNRWYTSVTYQFFIALLSYKEILRPPF